jgi:hypothetical protein
MISELPIKDFSEKIKTIYRAEPSSAEAIIEEYLKVELAGLSQKERISCLTQLRDQFASDGMTCGEEGLNQEDDDAQEAVLFKIFSLLLGNKVSTDDLSSLELLNRLATSLNTIFDLLNELIGVINQSLYGKQYGDETIRQVIGNQVISEESAKPLDSYLGQIKEAFLTSRRASEDTVKKIVNGILKEIDPDKIAGGSEGGFKFGPLRKAEYFDIFKEKFNKIEKWSQSERFSIDFSREFERNCEKRSKHEGGF